MARKPTRGAARAPFSGSSSGPSTSKSKSKSSSQSKSQSQSQSAPRKRRLDPSNAYTYLPSLPKRHRTSEAQLSLSREEAAAGPSTRGTRGPGPRREGEDDGDGDSDEDMEERIRKMAMMIAEEGPGAVDSEESSIDSDEAWEAGGSDEERWGDVFRDLQKGKGKKGKSKAKEVVRKVSNDTVWSSGRRR
jgi:U3 small nucleolar RNA-associated protein 14